MELPSQDVEEVSGGGAVHNLYVVMVNLGLLFAVLPIYNKRVVLRVAQEPLRSRTAVFATETFIAVRQEERQRSLDHPLPLPRH